MADGTQRVVVMQVDAVRLLVMVFALVVELAALGYLLRRRSSMNIATFTLLLSVACAGWAAVIVLFLID